MEGLVPLGLGLLTGFLLGAVSAFFLSRRFLRRRSSQLYQRWRRKDLARHKERMSQIAHDLKNPLFLIQAFTWSYMDRAKKKNLSDFEIRQSSDEMADILHRQATKALDALGSAESPLPKKS